MCGIAGFSGNFSIELLVRMNASIRHRGPDDSGSAFIPEAGVGMAHRRLSIIDLSPLGRQPMWDQERKTAIVFNGEIYNYRELRHKLAIEGYRFISQSDTEVLLALYLREGEEMLPLLNGIFAFAIWDSTKRSLFLARDGIGVKPLYFAQTPAGFLFASELKALLEEPGLSRDLDYLALDHYLTFLWCPAPRTMLKAVRKLEPGNAMVVKDGKVLRQWCFYDLPYDQSIQEKPALATIEELREVLKTAVSRQMVADVPVGAFLSGGLDSSMVVAMARQEVEQLDCFTIGFEGDVARAEGMTADLPYAERVARHLGVKLHTIYVGPEMISRLGEMIYYLDEPQADPAPLNVLFISTLARENGIKVLLSGAGGDDIFSGYRRHRALMTQKYWDWLPKALRSGISHSAQRLPVSQPLMRRLVKALEYGDLDGDQRITSYFFWARSEYLRGIYTKSVSEELNDGRNFGPLLEALNRLPANTHPLNRMLYLDAKFFLPDHNLNYTDKMSMATGVEVRVPLLDPDLVCLAARLPISFKQQGAVGKWIFKKAAEPYLPFDAIYRPKTGFGAPLRHWLRNDLSSVIDETLSEGSLKRRGIFDHAAVRRFVEMDRKGRIDGAYTIFALLCVEIWCRMFVDSATPRALTLNLN